MSARGHRILTKKHQANPGHPQTFRSRPRGHHRSGKTGRRHPMVRPNRQRQRTGHPAQLRPGPQSHRKYRQIRARCGQRFPKSQ